MGDATVTSGPNIARLWRGQAAEWTHRFHEARQWPIVQALRSFGATTRPVLYRDEAVRDIRSEEHTSELQSLMRISYAVFCLKKKKNEINEIESHKLDDAREDTQPSKTTI